MRLGNRPYAYDIASDVRAYVRQNPWSKFDPLGLQESAPTELQELERDLSFIVENEGSREEFRSRFSEWVELRKSEMTGPDGMRHNRAVDELSVRLFPNGRTAKRLSTTAGQIYGQMMGEMLPIGPRGRPGGKGSSKGGSPQKMRPKSKGGTSPGGKSSKQTKQQSDDDIEWVKENASMSDRAKDYDSGAPGSRDGHAPRLKAEDNYGEVTAKFDGVDGGVMVDRKLSIYGSKKADRQVLRQSAVLGANNRRGRWEVPDEKVANTARRKMESLGVKNIDVVVAPE